MDSQESGEPKTMAEMEARLARKYRNRDSYALDCIRYLDSHDPDVRYSAIRLLTDLNARQYASVIARFLHDSSIDVRIAAVESVGALSYQQAEDELIDILHSDEAPIVRTCAAESLGLLSPPSGKVIEALTGALKKDDDILVKSYAVNALGTLNSKESAQVLSAHLRDAKNTRLRASILAALAKFGDEQALILLMRMIDRVKRSSMDVVIANLLDELTDAIPLDLFIRSATVVLRDHGRGQLRHPKLRKFLEEKKIDL